jgi:hypothetical protein
MKQEQKVIISYQFYRVHFLLVTLDKPQIASRHVGCICSHFTVAVGKKLTPRKIGNGARVVSPENLNCQSDRLSSS